MGRWTCAVYTRLLDTLEYVKIQTFSLGILIEPYPMLVHIENWKALKRRWVSSFWTLNYYVLKLQAVYICARVFVVKNAMSRNRHVIIFSRASKNSIYHMNFMSDINWVAKLDGECLSSRKFQFVKMDLCAQNDGLVAISVACEQSSWSQIFQRKDIIFPLFWVLIWICTQTHQLIYLLVSHSNLTRKLRSA